MIKQYKSFYVAGEMIDRRAMLSIGEPIGSPHLPPFKQRPMPFAPLAGAWASAAAAFTATGAAFSVGTAALAAVNLVGVAAMYAGVAMTVTGLITGDKGLMKLGGIVGLAGGVASLAAGGIASLAAGGDLALGTAGIDYANAANAVTAAGGEAASTMAPVIGQAMTSEQVLAQAGGNAAQNLTAAGVDTGALGADMSAVAGGNFAPVANNMAQINNAGGLLNKAAMLNAGSQGVANGVTNVINYTNTGGVQAAAGSGGFFNELIGSMTPKDWVLTGGAVLSGGAKAVAANEANAQRQQQFEYEQGIRNQQIKNLNSVPMLTAGPAKVAAQQ